MAGRAETKNVRPLYDNLGRNEQLALSIDADVTATKNDDWRGNRLKEREVKYVIHKHLSDETEAERVFELVKNQIEY